MAKKPVTLYSPRRGRKASVPSERCARVLRKHGWTDKPQAKTENKTEKAEPSKG